MKSSSFQYPFSLAISLFEKILKKEGHIICFTDIEGGRIKAFSEEKIDNEYRTIDVEVIPQRNSSIRVNVFVNALRDIYVNTILDERPYYELLRTSCTSMEEKLMKTLMK